MTRIGWTLLLAAALLGCRGPAPVNEQAPSPAAQTFTCPIDGMEMEVSKAVDSVEHEGKTYYFCMEGEKETFLQDPEKYAGP